MIFVRVQQKCHLIKGRTTADTKAWLAKTSGKIRVNKAKQYESTEIEKNAYDKSTDGKSVKKV